MVACTTAHLHQITACIVAVLICAITQQLVKALFQTQAVPHLISALINELTTVTQDFTLVIDDYHLINTKTIHEDVQMLLERLPAALHLVIISRVDPPWPLGKLRVRGELNELRLEDLRFTLEESATFLRQVMQLDLSNEEIGILEARMEGWVAGLQLAALGLCGHFDPPSFVKSFKGSHRFVLEYLAGNC